MTPHERFEQLFTDESASVLRYAKYRVARSAEGRAVMARAMSMVPGNAVPSRKPRRLLVGGAVTAALTVAGGTAVGAVVLLADSPTQAGCYSALSPQADTVEASAELVAEKARSRRAGRLGPRWGRTSTRATR